MGHHQCRRREALRICKICHGAVLKLTCQMYLRNFLTKTHLQDLIESTAHIHYESFRSKQLLALKEQSAAMSQVSLTTAMYQLFLMVCSILVKDRETFLAHLHDEETDVKCMRVKVCSSEVLPGAGHLVEALARCSPVDCVPGVEKSSSCSDPLSFRDRVFPTRLPCLGNFLSYTRSTGCLPIMSKFRVLRPLVTISSRPHLLLLLLLFLLLRQSRVRVPESVAPRAHRVDQTVPLPTPL